RSAGSRWSLRAPSAAAVPPCVVGARRMAELFDRSGRDAAGACSGAIIDRPTQTFRREVTAKIPPGRYVWEDYAEHDGVDPPRLHTQRIAVTRTDDDAAPPDLIIDFAGTSPQARGPINHSGEDRKSTRL